MVAVGVFRRDGDAASLLRSFENAARFVEIVSGHTVVKKECLEQIKKFRDTCLKLQEHGELPDNDLVRKTFRTIERLFPAQASKATEKERKVRVVRRQFRPTPIPTYA